jgi:hypothetical protein
MSLATSSAAPPAALRALLNAVPSVAWSLLGFLPVGVFWFEYLHRPWLYGSLLVSCVAYVLPTAQLRRLELRQGDAFYRRVGVPWANRLVQDGALVNWVLQRRAPGYRRFRSRADALRLLRGTYANERFHWAAFLFSVCSAVYAATKGLWGWSLGLLLVNILYNLYPIWLQQSVRIRLERYLSRPHFAR